MYIEISKFDNAYRFLKNRFGFLVFPLNFEKKKKYNNFSAFCKQKFIKLKFQAEYFILNLGINIFDMFFFIYRKIVCKINYFNNDMKIKII